MSTKVQASQDALFDRLRVQDVPPAQAGDAWRASLRRDLLRLLNTRNGLTVAEYLEAEASVLQFGLPDVMALSPRSEEDLQVLAEVVRLAVCRFEPRLAAVVVQACPDPRDPSRARLAVSASAAGGGEARRIHFDIDLSGPGLLEAAAA